MNSVSEKGAMQLLFDIRYLIKFFEGVLGNDTLHLNIEEKLKAKIDPIDMAVAESPLNINVERYYVRTCSAFGSLLILNPKPIDLYFLINLVNEPLLYKKIILL